MEYNYNLDNRDCTDIRGKDYVKNNIMEIVNLFGCIKIEECKLKIIHLMNMIGLYSDLHLFGIKKLEDLQIVKSNVNAERLMNNPRKLTEMSKSQILKKIYYQS